MFSSSINWFKYAAPQRFYALTGSLIPYCVAVAVIATVIGLTIGLLIAPSDHQQGESYRIIFIHVPAAWMSMIIYLAVAFWAAIGLIFNARLASMFALALAPTGALMTFIALWTGSLWGKPTWGTYWVWDARLTSELILLFLYLGFLSLHASIEDTRKADRSAAVLAIVGVVNIPIIYFSVKWWNTLHQGASVSITKGSSMAQVMLEAMLIMSVAFWMFAVAMALYRVRSIILVREKHTQWVANLPEVKARMMKNTAGGAQA